MQLEEIRRDLVSRLQARREEIEQATLTRIYAVPHTARGSDPDYVVGLKKAVTAAVTYGIEAVDRSEDHPPPMPTVLLAQARLAARHGVKLETVLRRYLAGYTLLGDFLIEESERSGRLSGTALKRLLRVQAALLDRLIAAVSEEYAREVADRTGSAEQRRAERIDRLLAGELVDASDLGYDFEAHHLGLIASGPGAPEAMTALLKTLDCCRLSLRRDEDLIWGWLGGRHEADVEELERRVSQNWPAKVSLAIGEPGQALAGWRLSHQQARAALPVAQRGSRSHVRYADVALLAAALQDELLGTSLRELYLAPLAMDRDGGAVLKSTLHAYFASRRNVTSTAEVVGVTRKTVNSRLRAIEHLVGRSIDAFAAEMETALRLQELDAEPGNGIGSAPRIG